MNMTVDTLDRDVGHLASPALLRKIDQLREKNIGQHVPLPQVGAQCLQYALLNSHYTIACCCRRPKLR